MAGARDADMVCKGEPTLERAVGDATMKIGRVLDLFGFLGRDQKSVFANFDRKIIFRESGNGDGNGAFPS